jgi:hypothetical protein
MSPEKKADLVFNAMVAGMTVVALAVCVLVSGGCSPCRYASKKVVKVGGCDRFGECGVRYNDGSSGSCYYPVEGSTCEVRICQ